MVVWMCPRRELDAAIANRGRPLMIVSDNGTEFTSMGHPALVSSDKNRVALHRSRQAAAECFFKSFNGRLRDELLNETLFSSFGHARNLLAD
jgi:putative transposase